MFLSVMKIRKKTTPLIIGMMLACMPIGFVPAAQAQAQQAQPQNEASLIARAERAINEIETLDAEFIQVSSDGTVGKGKIYLRRPHQLRLDYLDPETLSFVTSKVWLYVDDKLAKTVQVIPIKETPFAPLLAKKVSFRQAHIRTSAKQQDGLITLSLIREEGAGAGQLELEFEAVNWRLKRWVITDTLGVRTAVTLQNRRYGRKLANKLFGVPSYASGN